MIEQLFAELIEVFRLRPRAEMEPIYYVQHPDGSYTKADPQPSMAK